MIQRLFYDPKVDPSKVEEISSRLGISPLEASKEELIETVKALPLEEKFLWGKSTLFLTTQKGRFLKKCPGSPGVVCCNYYTINTISGCPFDCTYCILQNYIENNPFITAFVNREDMIPEIAHYLSRFSKLRFGTGELTDSLVLDSVLEESLFFLRMIHEQQWENRITMEFKTKSAAIDSLLEGKKRYPHVDVVVGFSVNIPTVTEHEEYKTAPFEERLKAMRRLQRDGIPVAIHFDPILMIEDLLPAYKQLAKEIFSHLDHRLIRWISLGGYRHTLSLAPVIEKRFPHSLLLAGEMFPSESDHKYRYFKPMRRSFYQEIIRTIQAIFTSAPLYLCMEKDFILDGVG
ncbi:MAG: radical SAM protein, partial [Brevinematales bacterium]